MIELIVIHIHKTAGVSLLQAVKHVYGEESFAPYNRLFGIKPRQDLLLYTDYDARKALWDEALKRVPVHVQVLQDHAPVQLYDGLYPGVKRITWLRDPVWRVVSAYIYDKPGCSIYEFIRRKRERNVMTFFTAGGDMERFAFVGVVENFARDMARLSKLLEWPAGVPVVHRNECRDPELKRKLLSDLAVVAEIEWLNKYDRELYNRFRGTVRPTFRGF